MSDEARPKVHVGTGVSRPKDASESGKAAAAQAVQPLAGEAPALVMAFATRRYDLPALLAGIRSVTGTALLVGSTGSGEIVQGEYLGFGGGVGVLAMTAGRYPFAAASASGIGYDLFKAGLALARASRDRAGSSPYAAMIQGERAPEEAQRPQSAARAGADVRLLMLRGVRADGRCPQSRAPVE